MVATRKRTRNFIKFIYHLILKLAISALISILASLELVKNGFFWVKNCFNCWNLQFLSFRNVIYLKKGILILLYCLKMCEVAIALRKSKNAPRARTSQVSKKPVRTRTSQLATAHRNSQLAIAHRKSCLGNEPISIYYLSYYIGLYLKLIEFNIL